MILIGLSGYAGSGKDSVATLLVEHHGFRQIGFADAVRDFAIRVDPLIGDEWELFGGERQRLSTIVEQYGWDAAKREFPEVREALQRIGVAARAQFDPAFWIKQAFAVIDGNPDQRRWVIADVRFRNEAETIHRRGGHVIRVTRPGVEAANGHISEHELESYPFDRVLANGGSLDDLRQSTGAVLASLPNPWGEQLSLGLSA